MSSQGYYWSKEDDAVLISGVTAKEPNKVIARRLSRTVHAISARTSYLRKKKVLPAAKIGRREKQSSAHVDVQGSDLGTPLGRSDLSIAVFALGRLMPAGMKVTIYRPKGNDSSAIEVTHADGDVSNHSINARN